MAKLTKWLGSTKIFLASLAIVVVFLAAHIAPASLWLDVRSIRVFDSVINQPILMAVDREVKHDFPGQWVVTIRRFENGGWVSHCTATGLTNYKKGAVFPDPLTLKWWTYPGCNPLPAGKYLMTTTWFLRIPFFPEKIVSHESNIFEVAPK